MVDSTTEHEPATVRRCYRRRNRPPVKASLPPSSRNCDENDSSSRSAVQEHCQATTNTHRAQNDRRPETIGSTLPQRSIPSISLPVPPSVPSDWLIQTTPLILVKYLLYTRGLIPMTVDQLYSWASGEGHTSNIGTSRSRTPPSVRRRIERSRTEISQLFHQWTSLESSWKMLHQHHPREGSSQRPSEIQHPIPHHPAFVLISLGPSFIRSRELYLLDLQSWEWQSQSPPFDDDESHASLVSGADDDSRSRRMEGILARRLISTLINDDDCPANALPAKSSPSFRLWLTLGFDKEHHNCELSPGGADGIEYSTTSHPLPMDVDGILPAFIRRSRLPLVSSRPKIRTTRTGTPGVVSIRLTRRIQQHQCTVEEEKELYTSNLEPTSSRLIWMSLPTCIKGFRL